MRKITVKRVFDLFFAATMLIACLPLMISIAIYIRLFEGGPVIFKQKRIGLNNRPFAIRKFRTLKNETQTETKLPSGGREIRGGRMLRKYKLDELPQLLNVLAGEMSVVGPRPLIQAQFDRFSGEVKKALYGTKPGMTGVGSLYFRDEEKILKECGMDAEKYYVTHIIPRKGELELWYSKNRSLRLDIKIIGLTVITIVNEISLEKWGLP